jgi:multidrug resistance efflux pump
VRRGQVLARFAPTRCSADVAQARASLAEGRGQRRRRRQQRGARPHAADQTGAMSASQINQYLTAEKTAQARVEAARAQCCAQQVRWPERQVLAPDDGVISARTATVGAVVANGTELFRLIRKGRLEWRAEVTSAELGASARHPRAIVTATSGAGWKAGCA